MGGGGTPGGRDHPQVLKIISRTESSLPRNGFILLLIMYNFAGPSLAGPVKEEPGLDMTGWSHQTPGYPGYYTSTIRNT